MQAAKREVQQKSRPLVFCEGKKIKNVDLFQYLGSLFASDGDQQTDIKARIAMAMTRSGQLSHIFDSPEIGKRLKLRLYKVAICSLLMYGCESWVLTGKVLRQLNGANSSMLARITGQSIREEARRATTSFDLVRQIRVMRLKWLGYILQQDEARLIFQAIEVQYDFYQTGSILMDAPRHKDLQDLIVKAKDTAFWKEHINFI